MKKLLLSAVVLLAMGVSLTSCKDDKKADTVEEAVENTVEATEDAMEETADAVEEVANDAGEAVEDAADATEDALEDAAEATEEAMKNLKENESVTVTYAYTALGKEIKGSKTFSGTQKDVEAAVKKLSDSIKKIDPKVKVTIK